MSIKLRNVGPKSAAWLRQVGVRTQEDLERLGALDAYIRVKRAGFRPSLNLLYALEGALLGCHWQDLPEDRRNQLVAEAEAASALLPPPRGKTVHAAPVTTTMHHRAGDEAPAEEGAETIDPVDDSTDERSADADR